jgi:hypothetical protein
MFNVPLSSMLLLKLAIFDIDYDGSYTYLFEARIGGQYQTSHISYTSKNPLKVKEGDHVYAKVDGNCSKAFGVDEALSDKLGAWVSFQSFICAADSVVPVEDR